MDVTVKENKGKWEVLTDLICYDKFDTEPEAVGIAIHLRRIAGLMDELQEIVHEETTEWDDVDKAMFRSFYGAETAQVLAL